MSLRILLATSVFAACTSGDVGVEASADSLPTAGPDTVRVDWSGAFDEEGAIGTFVLYAPEADTVWIYNPERAATRFSPASTSKVFNSLVFLDQGVVSNPDSLFAWDGVERQIRSWNRDHSLRSGVQFSAVWLFQRAALEVGPEGYAEVFARQPYGNSTLSDTLEMSWLDGTWRVSAHEQIAFLDGLRRSTLGFSAEDQATVRDLMPVLDEGDGWRLLGKTGWGLPEGEPEIGWIVGWVERPDGDAIYAMNAEEVPGAAFDVGPGRLRIVRAVLREAGVLLPDGP